MIGEDFRSRALANLVYANGLEQQIEDLKGEITKRENAVDNKDLELVLMERQKENAMMQTEEYLTRYVLLRENHDETQSKLE
jgi:TolA-binding protein|mmetsp:Transcript_23/g.35  ORF Transcript_23/g.35 Transcript_23/m.35 type:complete len:82 (+) Transcript_23:2457-2702(+)